MEYVLSLALIAALVLIWAQCTQIEDMEKDRARDADTIDVYSETIARLREEIASLKGRK